MFSLAISAVNIALPAFAAERPAAAAPLLLLPPLPIDISHRYKKRFYGYFILVTFFTFLTFFLFSKRFLYFKKVGKQINKNRFQNNSNEIDL